MNLKAINQNEKYEKIKEKKISTPAEVLCRGLPPEFTQYINYSKNLKFEQKPDYAFIR